MSGGGVTSEASGRLTGSELLTAMTELNSPALAESPVLYAFLDLNGVTAMDISTIQLRAAADLSIRGSRYQSASRVVAIHANGDLAFALARMWQVFVEQTGWETHVFRERSQAVTWVRARVAARFGIQAALDIDGRNHAGNGSA
ncbi:MAG: hypothetical protein HC869_19630 [Rhodospirillales bacterium]|nr:hypothetical protein [Rhodospirillales bacterium]